MQDLESLKAALSVPRKIVITTHFKPDADALGSSLGMANYLMKKGHDVQVITPSDYPAFLFWMKGNDDVLVYRPEIADQVRMRVNAADIILTLDFSNLNRIDDMGEMVRESPAYKINIDHHLEPEKFANFTLWNTKAAATCELCFELIDALGDKSLIDADIADCLYAGIMTDTGNFRHGNTTQNVHEVIAELIQLGADNTKVARKIYDGNSLNRLRFIGYALSEKLTVMPEYHTAYFAITAEELQRFESQTGDTEGLVNYALSLKGIVFAAMFTDRKQAVKMSFRSVGEFPANEIAAKYFNGGGHRNAAGGKSDDTLQETIEKFRSVVPAYKELLDKESLEI